MMYRTQVLFDEETRKRAARRAAELGLSFSEYVRRVITADVEEQTPTAGPEILFDLGTSSGADVANDKDAMVGAAVTAGRRRARRP